MSTPAMAIDENKLHEFMGKAVGDIGAAMHSILIALGDRLGLYKAMADSKPVTLASWRNGQARMSGTSANG